MGQFAADSGCRPLQAWDREFQWRQGLALRVLHDTELDALELTIRASSLPGGSSLRLQILITPPDSPELVDTTPAFNAYGAPPPAARVLLAFWNVFPAYTPAQALRRWDGAHTGPYGGRHGLYNLLRTARNHHIPLALLDLKNPASLSALDATGGLELVQQMVAQDLLLLPDVHSLPDGATYSSQFAAALSRQTASNFGLPASPWVYLPSGGNLPPGYLDAILPRMDPPSNQADLVRQAGVRWLVFSTMLPGDQAGVQAPSLEVRRALVQSALLAAQQDTIYPSTITILGGSLPESAWGDPSRARQSFRYLASRPWVHILSPHDLLALPASSASDFVDSALPPYSPSFPSQDSPALISPGLYEISTLYAPLWPAAAQLPDLRSLYSSQLNIVQIAERWASAPGSDVLLSGCDQDLDGDQVAECLLVSPQVLAIFDQRSGALTYLFVHHAGQFHQVIAPTSQLALGLSDPAGWDLSAGLSADPAVIPGAFAATGSFPKISLNAPRLVFQRPGLEQAYQLLPVGLRAEFTSDIPVTLQLPIILDPWIRFNPGWSDRFSANLSPKGWIWRLKDGPQVTIRTDSLQSSAAFTDGLPYLSGIENPNVDYPPGHFLPFPSARLEVGGKSTFSVEIELYGD